MGVRREEALTARVRLTLMHSPLLLGKVLVFGSKSQLDLRILLYIFSSHCFVSTNDRLLALLDPDHVFRGGIHSASLVLVNLR